ncbi:DNA topoisomerase [Elizabethkingia ursingii]|uniref:Topo IA-type catalytic domain-containing protein n=1 Tax=Elizabethkingia ursingii TaxID=1756150 RepID=A0AAJ3N9W0_9FLAO|nr:DNA topoisomerase [Elizabethkingia ursingii]AQX10258.1 hypothetical protein BBD34_17175 [Elizabethkingia ursingii]OPB72386.1 hypothetical protein BAY32_12575 [Elizabethkingia ursingii]
MKIIVADGPRVAQEIAFFLGLQNINGHYTSTDFCIFDIKNIFTSDFTAHLSKQTGAGLPLFAIDTVKEEFPSLEKQYLLFEHLNNCTEIILALGFCSAEELMFHDILKGLNREIPVKRLLLNDLTLASIKEGFSNLLPVNKCDNLYHNIKRRKISIRAFEKILSGCLMESCERQHELNLWAFPLLCMIAEKFKAFKAHKSDVFWKLQACFRKDYLSYKITSELKWVSSKEAEKAIRILERYPRAIVSSIEKEKFTEASPLLFNLFDLSKEAYHRLGFSFKETLETALILYEKKFITFPVTSSGHIPKHRWGSVIKLADLLKENKRCCLAAERLNLKSLNKEIISDIPPISNHGILPTTVLPTGLNTKENALYNLISLRFLESLSNPCVKEITKIKLEALHYDFYLKGIKLLEKGWREVKGFYYGKEQNFIIDFPDLKIGDEIKISRIESKDISFFRPRLYDKYGLVSEVENFRKGLNLSHEVLWDIDKALNYLIGNGYIRKQNTCFIATDKGQRLYDVIKDLKIAKLEMPILWEMTLENSKDGSSDYSLFNKKLKVYISNIRHELSTFISGSQDSMFLLCPQCKGKRLKFKYGEIYCPDPGCQWTLKRKIFGKELSEKELESLITYGKTSLISGLETKSGKHFTAFLFLDKHSRVGFNC